MTSPRKPPLGVMADIHANVEALTAVLEDAAAQGVKRFVSLGDVVGYGADPDRVLDLLIKHRVESVSGNHDHAVFRSDSRMNPLAQEGMAYTREKLGKRGGRGPRARRWKYLDELPPFITDGQLQFVHGSLRDPLNEYVFGSRDSGFDRQTLLHLFRSVRWICFCGHTHKPVVIRDDAICWYPVDDDPVLELDSSRKYIANAGSVGQPRDGDSRACYAILEDRSIRYRRVDYDVDAAIRKIRAIGERSHKWGGLLRLGM